MLKRVAIMLFCLLMIFVATFGFVVGVVSVPTIYSYAEVVDDDPIYVPLRDPSDLVQSFQAYCSSRDLTIEGSIADAVTTFTTGAFNSACNTLGINISQLQAEIKAEYDQSGKPIKFLYNTTGIGAMNRIFAQFLQDNELEVGDSANEQNNTVSNGDYFIDLDGNGCYVLKVNTTSGNTGVFASNVLDDGSQYVNSYSQIYNFIGEDTTKRLFNTYHINSNDTVDLYGAYDYVSGGWWRVLTVNSNTARTQLTDRTYLQGYLCIEKTADGVYFLAIYMPKSTIVVSQLYRLNNISTQNAVVFLTTNNTVINNNIYEGDTYITNEGDVINDPTPVPPGGTDPGWDIGGGGGTATDGNGNTWNIQFPDFQLPDLNIDWSINGLGEKFPFSIPFDLVALVTVLNAEPQAPRFEGTVNFGFTTWDYDINLQQFDSVAQACRIAELLLLVVGLILITRSIIKG